MLNGTLQKSVEVLVNSSSGSATGIYMMVTIVLS